MGSLSGVLTTATVSGLAGRLPEFAYLFLWLAWPAAALQTGMACTSAADIHSRWEWGYGSRDKR